MSLATFIHSTNTHRLSLCEHRPIGERGPLSTKELVAQQEARTHPQLTGIPFDGDEDSDGGERAPGGRINRDGMQGRPAGAHQTAEVAFELGPESPSLALTQGESPQPPTGLDPPHQGCRRVGKTQGSFMSAVTEGGGLAASFSEVS